MATDTAPNTAAAPTCPATNAHPGIGVDLSRFSTRRSLASPTAIATEGNVAKKAPIATADGVAYCITRTPVVGSTTAFPATNPMSTSQAIGMPNEKMTAITEPSSPRTACAA